MHSSTNGVIVTQPNKWLYLYGFRGLRFRSDDQLRWYFGNLTIASKQAVEAVLSSEFLDGDRVPPDAETRYGDLLPKIISDFVVTSADCYIGALGAGNTGGDTTPMGQACRRRATMFAALLSVAFLGRENSLHGGGLSEDVHSNYNTLRMFRTQPDGTLIPGATGGPERRFLPSTNPPEMNIEQLREELAKSHCARLSEIVLKIRPAPAFVSKPATAALLRLYEGIHAVLPASQLLGAVTTIELLLDSDWKSIDGRLEALIGSDASQHYGTQEILNARHQYVHQGASVSQQCALRSIGLALEALLAYVQAGDCFESKEALLAELDFINVAGRLSTTWTPEKSEHFRVLLKHGWKPYLFDFHSPTRKVTSSTAILVDKRFFLRAQNAISNMCNSNDDERSANIS